MTNLLTNIHVKKVDLVGVPAIGKTITLFKSKEGDMIKDKDKDTDVVTLAELVKDLSDEERTEFQKALGIEPPKEDAIVDKVLKALGIKKEDAPPLIKDDEVRKSITVLTERAEKSEAETTKLTKQLEERDARERRDEALKLAKSLSDLGLTPDDHADTLQKWQEADPEGFKAAIGKLEAAGVQLKESVLYGELGSNAPGAGSAEAELEALALEVQKAKPDITIEAARAEVTKSNKALYDRITKEENERKRKV